jgi:hypothetical protein
VRIARGLERRLERLLEGVAGRVFSGRVHPSELAERVAREADLARYVHLTGPATANAFTLTLNPRDVASNHDELELELGQALTDYAAEKGLRLAGPARIVIDESESVANGQLLCLAEVKEGPIPSWARLLGPDTFPIGPNRALVGRGDDADLRIPFDDISRHHAVIWREQGRAWIADLESANGTTLDGTAVGVEPVPLEHGAMLTLAGHGFRFLEG